MSNGSSSPVDDPNPSTPGAEDDDQPDYFDELPDGSGCTEIWEYLSERRSPNGNGKETTEES